MPEGCYSSFGVAGAVGFQLPYTSLLEKIFGFFHPMSASWLDRQLKRPQVIQDTSCFGRVLKYYGARRKWSWNTLHGAFHSSTPIRPSSLVQSHAAALVLFFLHALSASAPQTVDSFSWRRTDMISSASFQSARQASRNKTWEGYRCRVL